MVKCKDCKHYMVTSPMDAEYLCGVSDEPIDDPRKERECEKFVLKPFIGHLFRGSDIDGFI